MLALAFIVAFADQVVEVPDRVHLCAVVPTSMAALVRDELNDLPDLNDATFQEKWIVEFDDDSTYVYLRSDHAISFYTDRLTMFERLKACVIEGKSMTIAELPAGIRGATRQTLSRLGSLPESDNQVSLGIGVTEHYVFSNNGQSVEADLKFRFGEPTPIRPGQAKGGQQGSGATITGLVSESATEGVTFLHFGPRITHRANAILGDRAIKRYSDLVKKLEEAAEVAGLEAFGLAASKGRFKLEPLSYKPTAGGQLDDKRLQSLLMSGIPTNKSEGIDVTWLKGAEIKDQYYLVVFSVYYADDKGVINRASDYALPVRRRNPAN